MLAYEVSITSDLEVHLNEVSAIVVRIGEACKGLLREVAIRTSVSDDKRSFGVIEVRSVAHFGFSHE